MNRRVTILIYAIGLCLVGVQLGGIVQAQNRQSCFNTTGFCVEGRFLDFWRANGGLPVFGYPVSTAAADSVEDRDVLLQWFERTRFELHAENTPPYDLLLGRVGAERLQQLDRDWQREPRESGPKPGCLWFAQTSHNVCDQAGVLGFKSYWQSHGLLNPQLSAFERSLALFGLPLTEVQLETNVSDNQLYLTQWFERARFEWHPENPDQFKVLLGLLGNELRISTPSTPLITPTLTITPSATQKPEHAPIPTWTPSPVLPHIPIPPCPCTPIPTATATAALPIPPGTTILPMPPPSWTNTPALPTPPPPKATQRPQPSPQP